MLLPAQETKQIVHLLTHLDVYADKFLGLKTDIRLKDVPTELRNQVRVQWYDQPEVLESYIRDNPDKLAALDLEVLESWKGLRRERYMVVKCLKSGAILVSQSRHYQVLGWYDSLEDLLYGQALPAMVETTLLPMGGKLTYDGILLRFNIHFGAGTRKNLNEEYSYARRHGQILTSLGHQPRVEPTGPIASEHRAAVQSIQQATEKLRGGGTRPPATAQTAWPDSQGI